MNVDASYFRKKKWLYHFTSFNITKTIIRDKKLKYSMLRRANDVCEYAKTIYNEYFPDSRDSVIEDIEREIYLYRQISLSEDKLVFGRKGFDLQQMWGLYADNGYGACLVFDKDEIIGSLPEDCVHGAVNYETDITPCTMTSVRYNKDVQHYIKDNIKTIFFNKRKEWEHEQEYRILNRFNGNECEQYLSFNNSLKYVILQNSRTINAKDSIQNSCEYICLRHLLPNDVHVLVYNPFVNRQSLHCYDYGNGEMELWNSDEDYTQLTDIDI